MQTESAFADDSGCEKLPFDEYDERMRSSPYGKYLKRYEGEHDRLRARMASCKETIAYFAAREDCSEKDFIIRAAHNELDRLDEALARVKFRIVHTERLFRIDSEGLFLQAFGLDIDLLTKVDENNQTYTLRTLCDRLLALSPAPSADVLKFAANVYARGEAARERPYRSVETGTTVCAKPREQILAVEEADEGEKTI